MKKRLLIILLILAQLSISAENIHFETFNISDGLPQNTVTSIVQDDYGFLWFGTRDGLGRYDGQSFHVFKNTHIPGNALKEN